MLAGELVWIGREPLGAKDGKVSLYPRDLLPILWDGPSSTDFDPTHEAILETLAGRGASFFRDIYEAVGGVPDDTLDSLWDLVWSGHVTNDTFDPVRAYVGKRRSSTSGKRPLSGRFPAHAGGRWSLTTSLTSAAVSETERHAGWAEVLLDRHGVVMRTTALAESYPGGFTSLYPVFSHMEETGRIRRGYFVEGMGGSQFALPGAVDRLRGPGSGELVVLAATDPANPYGGVLPWPDIDDVRLARDAGAYVLLLDGRLVAYLDKGRRRLTLIDTTPDQYSTVSRALAEVASRHRRLTLTSVNGLPAGTSPIASLLAEWGFATAPRGLTYRG